ncbi:hypothetical protein R9C00_23905 [Flammeovirgaceae bacterium SG7u.111]|nr:hypothetical protein [Flammeovirgaceae bacterium SG7u.132]WPO34747.1 hypothetical protein R9C00_23905 [Flammeovirgaceae bacterium SG7u.111]
MKKKYFIGFFAVLLIFGLALPPLFIHFLKKELYKQAEENTIFNISLGEVSVELFPLSILLDDARITTNPADSSSSFPQLDVKFPAISLKQISLWSYLLDEQIQVGTLNLSPASVQVNFTADTSSLFDSLSCLLSLQTSNLSFDKKHPENIQLENHQLSITQLKTNTSDGFYSFTLEELKSEGKEQLQLEMSGLNMTPNYSKAEFAQRKKYQTEQAKLFIEKAIFTDFNLAKAIKEKYIDLSSIQFQGLNLELFRDKHYPRKPNQFKPLPQAILRNLPWKFAIGNTEFANSFLQYEELIKEAENPGSLFFESINANILNITNDSLVNPSGKFSMKAKADFMGEGKLDVAFNFDMFREDNQFDFSGSLSTMSLTSINPILENIALVHIESGKMEKMDFFITADESQSIGNLHFYYSDLKAKHLPPTSHANANIFKKVLFDLMESMLIPKENLAGKKFRKGKVNFQRDKEKSIVNYWWKSIFSGLKSTVGIKKPAQ